MVANVIVRSIVLSVLAFYTAFAAGPFVWVALMSLRTSSEIAADPYAIPDTLHWWKYSEAWFNSNYETYFWNSTMITVSSVIFLSLFGAMAAYCLARFRFPGNRFVLFLIFSTIILPPQITIIGVFQLLV